jgi:hypothetical protein
MKKLILLVFLFIQLGAYAQTKYYASTVSIGRYSDNLQKWLFGERKDCGLTFTLYDKYMTVDDKASSVYEVVSEGVNSETASYKSLTWEAIDEDSRKVRIIVIYHKDVNSMTLNVIYNYYAFSYSIYKL